MTRVDLADQPLPLDGLDVDVPLPFGDTAAAAWHVTARDQFDEAARLRVALAEALHTLDRHAPGVMPAERWRAWRTLAGIPAHDAGLTPEQRRDDGIARAAAKWTDDETAAVDRAIATVARARLDAVGDTDELVADGPTFTTADVWAELGPGFPVTKGIAGRMAAAKSAGLITSTGRTVIAPRDATGPNHGQRLTVWRAL